MFGIYPQEVRIYVSKNGRSPYSDWISLLEDVKGKGVIQTRIARIRTGNFGDCESVGGGMSELKIDFGPGYRIYFARERMNLILLLCGGDKRSEVRDIE